MMSMALFRASSYLWDAASAYGLARAGQQRFDLGVHVETLEVERQVRHSANDAHRLVVAQLEDLVLRDVQVSGPPVWMRSTTNWFATCRICPALIAMS
jgi:hypothetical protein